MNQVVTGREVFVRQLCENGRFPNSGNAMLKVTKRWALRLALLSALISSPAFAASSGNLQGIVQDESGTPLANILVSLLDKTSEQSIPILTRTTSAGRVFLENLEAGDYEVRVKTSGYRVADVNPIEILPGKTSVIKLVLQQLLDGNDVDGNLSVKSVLRTPTQKRLIFRDQPMDLPGSEPLGQFFDNAVFQVYTNAGLGDDYLILPGDSSTGTTTNFAFVDSFIGNGRYIFAGQLNSGEDSLWRLKNLYRYDLGENNTMEVFLGYGRMSFNQPSLAAMGNPIRIGDEIDFVRATGTSHMLNVGFEDRLRLGDNLTVLWGFEMNRVRNDVTQSFVSPTAKVSYSPLPRTVVDLWVTSRRDTHANAVTLPGGEAVNLGDPLHFARIGDQMTMGGSRYYGASISRQIGANSTLEAARFDNERFAGTLPIVALFRFQPGMEVLQLDDAHARTSGYRTTWRQQFGDLRSSFSYIRGTGVGLSSQTVDAGVFDRPTVMALVKNRHHHQFAAELEAFIRESNTTITALMKMMPGSSAVNTLDSYSDVYETGNQGLHFFVRQIIPVPDALNFLGLNAPRFEALLDVRNLTNDNVGVIRTTQGDVVLVRAPRSVRGGIAFKF